MLTAGVGAPTVLVLRDAGGCVSVTVGGVLTVLGLGVGAGGVTETAGGETDDEAEDERTAGDAGLMASEGAVVVVVVVVGAGDGDAVVGRTEALGDVAVVEMRLVGVVEVVVVVVEVTQEVGATVVKLVEEGVAVEVGAPWLMVTYSANSAPSVSDTVRYTSSCWSSSGRGDAGVHSLGSKSLS